MSLQSSLRSIYDAFLLREAERRAAELGVDRAGRARALATAAHTRMAVAADVSEPDAAAVALSLYRDAATMFARALAVALDVSVEAAAIGPSDLLAWVDRAVARARLSAPDDEVRSMLELLANEDVGAFDDLDAATAITWCERARVALDWLGDGIETRSPSHIRAARGIRVSALALAVVGAAGFGTMKLIAPHNIAEGKRVSMSSQWPGTVDPSHCTDGSIDSAFGCSTQKTHDAWVDVDLGSVVPIKRVTIYNRGDGYFDEGLPFVLEVSEDGSKFDEVARRTTVFSQSAPWTESLGFRRVRHLRVRSAGTGPVTLAEIEAFAK